MTKVIFVGIHNKPGMEPLDSRTKTGMVIDMVIEKLPNSFECVKTNLFYTEYYPKADERERRVGEWRMRLNLSLYGDCLVVLLGKRVQKDFTFKLNTIAVDHPAFLNGTRLNNYINALVKTIKNIGV